MSDPVAFATARLDEEEAAARAASPGPWAIAKAKTAEAGELAILSGGATVIGSGYEGGGIWDLPDAEHIATHDPARTLRDIAADRAILAELERAREYSDHMFASKEPSGFARGEVLGERMRAATQLLTLELVVKIRIARWDDHPEYEAAWKP